MQIAGAQPSKPSKFTPLTARRVFTGYFPNRNPLVEPGSRVDALFYKGRTDSIWDGQNTEVSQYGTLIRRPGFTQYSTAQITAGLTGTGSGAGSVSFPDSLASITNSNVSAATTYNETNVPANFGVSAVTAGSTATTSTTVAGSAGSGGTATTLTLTLTVLTPVLTGTSVQVQASSNDTTYPVSSYQVYLDSVLTYTMTGGGLLTETLTGLTVGAHTVGVKVWNTHGTNATVTSTVVVGGADVLTLVLLTPTITANSIQIEASASDSSTYPVTAIQVYLDGSSTPVFTSATTPPITPINYTITGVTGYHTVVTKAWNTLGAEVSISSICYLTSGSPVTVINTSGGTQAVNPAIQDLSLNTAQPVNISKTSLHTLMPTGWGGKVIGWLVGWFGYTGASHISVGYTSNTNAQVNAQLADMYSRGIDCVVLDWYGTSLLNAPNDSVLNAIVAGIGNYPGMTFAISIDQQYFALNGYTAGTYQTGIIAAINHLSTYFSNSQYEKNGGDPIILMWDAASVAGANINWATVQAAIPTGTKVIQYQASGFSIADSAGSFFWIDTTDKTPVDGTGYLTGTVFPALTANQSMICMSAAWPGFDGTLTNKTAWSLGKYIDRQWGSTWLAWWAANNTYVTSGKRIDYIVIGTWDDYEEGSSIEPGILSNVVITPTMTGKTLSFSVAGNTAVMANYNILVSPDGINYTQVDSTTNSTTYSLDLDTLKLPAGTYHVYVQAEGMPCIVNVLSSPVTYISAAYGGGSESGSSGGNLPSPAISFCSFQHFDQTISVHADTASGVYTITPTTSTQLFAKSTGAGQTYFQSVGPWLFMSDGVDQLKWNGTVLETWGINPPMSAPTLSFTYGTANTYQPTGWSWVYCYQNATTGAISTASPVSASTNVMLDFTAGLTGEASTDPQTSNILIFRTTDGGATYLYEASIANPGSGTWSYTDTGATSDVQLNIFMEAPQAMANNPPPAGLGGLCYFAERIWGFVNTTQGCYVNYSAGPDCTVGNGNEAFPPLNYFQYPSAVIALVPFANGIHVFTVNDIYVIRGTISATAWADGATSGTIFNSNIYQRNIGLLSWNAVDWDGSNTYFFSTDRRLLMISPTVGGVADLGFPIGNVLMDFNPKTSYVACHSYGMQDQAVFIFDGAGNCFRCNPNQTPEGGACWSTKGVVTGGSGAMVSVETSPGVHQLLVGSGNNMWFRDWTSFSDNGSAYSAYVTFGSLVLAQPGTLAEVQCITLESEAIGTQASMSVLLNEISGDFETLSNYVPDPPQLPASTSLLSNRFYLNQGTQPVVCQHMQIKLDFVAEDAANELLGFSIYGAIHPE